MQLVKTTVLAQERKRLFTEQQVQQTAFDKISKWKFKTNKYSAEVFSF